MEKLFALTAKIPADKLGHFSTGAVAFALLHFVLIPLHAALAVAAMGVLKEAYDAAYNRWVRQAHGVELADAIATTLGGLIGYACTIPLQ